jgi:hypothetical protein
MTSLPAADCTPSSIFETNNKLTFCAIKFLELQNTLI